MKIEHVVEGTQPLLQFLSSNNQLINDSKEDALLAFESYRSTLILTSVIQGGSILTLAGSIIYAAKVLSKRNV